MNLFAFGGEDHTRSGASAGEPRRLPAPFPPPAIGADHCANPGAACDDFPVTRLRGLCCCGERMWS